LNVRINLGQLKDKKFKSGLTEKVRKVVADSGMHFKKISEAVEARLE
jgi:formiminotetrahydrofolate cyclodeaminase